jgi:hypothetical protein
MRFFLAALPLVAGCASPAPQTAHAPDYAAAKAPPVEYRSAFEGYRAFKDEELADWRNANEDVGAAGGHAGQRR